MKWRILLCASVVSTACGHTIALSPEALSADPRDCTRTERTVGVRRLTPPALEKKRESSECVVARGYGRRGIEGQLRDAMIAGLRRTGCFGEVHDLEAEPSARVDFVVSADVSRFEACADLLEEDADALARAETAGVLFGVVGAAMASPSRVRRVAYGDAVLQSIEVTAPASGKVVWGGGRAIALVRERASEQTRSPYLVGDRVLALLTADLARKVSRAIEGSSPYGIIDPERLRAGDGSPAAAVVASFEPDAESTLAALPASAKDLAPGYPVVMDLAQLKPLKKDLTGYVGVVAAFRHENDAQDWLRVVSPALTGLRLFLLDPR